MKTSLILPSHTHFLFHSLFFTKWFFLYSIPPEYTFRNVYFYSFFRRELKKPRCEREEMMTVGGKLPLMVFDSHSNHRARIQKNARKWMQDYGFQKMKKISFFSKNWFCNLEDYKRNLFLMLNGIFFANSTLCSKLS